MCSGITPGDHAHASIAAEFARSQPVMHDTQVKVNFNVPDRGDDLPIQIAPLIDIVFLLICFFMLTTQLVKSQIDAAVQLPVMSSQQAMQESPAEIVINLREDGALLVGGVEMAIDALVPYLTERHTRAESKRELLRVVVRADKRLRFGELEDVLNACRQSGLAVVVFRSQQGSVS
jgi:biopolymer transport protein ExbD